MKTNIFRRLFNAEEGKPNPKQLVASFPVGMENEAIECHCILERHATSFTTNESDVRLGFQKYRYTLEHVQPAIMSPSEGKGIQIDLSNAKKTPRPITYQFSWEIKHDECHCLAWHKIYGSIRGVVENSCQGRRLFINRITAVWPNANIIAH